MHEMLRGKDLRSIANVNELVPIIDSQNKFDELFNYLSDKDRLIRMRSADAIEKITITQPNYLIKHKSEIIKMSFQDSEKELKWHLALLLPRLELNVDELIEAFATLKKWSLNSKESKIVRTNSLQALYDLTVKNEKFKEEFQSIICIVQQENIPSINARLKKLGL